MKFITGFESKEVLKEHGDAVAFACVGDSLTVQADAKDADINNIMARYHKTGQFPAISRLPSYGDFEAVNDFRSALELVRAGEEQFMRLPAHVRAQFENDPAAFADYAADPAHHLELLELGVVSPEVADEIKARFAKVKENPTDGEDGGTAAARSDRTREPRASGKSRAKSSDAE